jgi:hypothetical protein
MIDWTKPVETTETPPRPVMVLYALGNDTPYGFVVFNITREHADEFWLMTDENRPTLRNVAPPKPEPVMYERWVTVWGDGALYGPFTSRPVEHMAGSQIIHFTWMSDGSPVPASPEQFDQMREMAALITERDRWKAECEHWAGTSSSWIFERDALKAERDQWKAQCEAWAAKATEWTEERDSLKAEVERLKARHTEDDTQIECLHASVSAFKDEVERMRPVVEAAIVWERHFTKLAADKLVAAVRAYLSTPKKTADEAAANVTPMMAPHKTCNNCRHCEDVECMLEGQFVFDENGDCQDWEMKND